MSYKINVKKFLSLSGVVLVLVGSLTACAKKADCNVIGSHAHLYRDEAGYVRYIDKEYLDYEGYSREDYYVDIKGQEELYRFLDKKDLMKIDDNLELILATQEKNKNFVEYRYAYTYMLPIPHTERAGKYIITYYTYVPVTKYSWTSDPNHSRLTGETRECHYVYVAYKVVQDEDGNYFLFSSDCVDDITDIKEEYPYIKKVYSKVVTLDGKEADYEDGKQEDMTDEEKKRAEEYDATHSEDTMVKNQSYIEEKGKTLVKR